MPYALADRWTSLLERPVPHQVQVYAGAAFLGDAVARFLGAGLGRGERAVVIASRGHRTAIVGALHARVGAAAARDLIEVDADQLLDGILRGGRPDRDRFTAEVVQPYLQGTVRVFSELAARAWARGGAVDAIAIEHMWNHALAGGDVRVLCGHALDAVGDGRGSFEALCAAHVQVLPSEHILQDDTDAQLARLARLEVRERAAAVAQASPGEAESVVRTIVEQTRDCIKVLDLEGRLQFLSRTGLDQLEVCEFDQVRGASYLSIWEGEQRAQCEAAIERARNGGIGEVVGLFPRDGVRPARWWHVVISPLRDAAQRVVSLLAVSRDITELKRLETELHAAVAARDQFLLIASHELKTPITSLKLQLDLMRRRLEGDRAVPPDHLGRLVDISRRQSELLVGRIDSMLDVARIRDGRLHLDPRPTELAELVGAVLERLADQFVAAGASVAIDVEGGLCGRWDRARIEQIVENLLTNVLRHAPGSGVEIRGTGDHATAYLTIRDHGPGIPSDRHRSIFDRFAAGTSVGGLGLGLFIARELAKAHGGGLRIDAEVTDGAALVLELPRARGDD